MIHTDNYSIFMWCILYSNSKVLSVVKDQITRTMSQQPSTLDTFRTKINSLTYAEIAEIWQQERINNEEQEMQAPPIKLVHCI